MRMSSRNHSNNSLSERKEKYIQIPKEFENLIVEKKTFSTALGFEPRSFDCRSTALTGSNH